MTQQEKRPVHCETCYSLSYSVTAPLPAARRCGELLPTATNHTALLLLGPRDSTAGPSCITADLSTSQGDTNTWGVSMTESNLNGWLERAA